MHIALHEVSNGSGSSSGSFGGAISRCYEINDLFAPHNEQDDNAAGG